MKRSFEEVFKELKDTREELEDWKFVRDNYYSGVDPLWIYELEQKERRLTIELKIINIENNISSK